MKVRKYGFVFLLTLASYQSYACFAPPGSNPVDWCNPMSWEDLKPVPRPADNKSSTTASGFTYINYFGSANQDSAGGSHYAGDYDYDHGFQDHVLNEIQKNQDRDGDGLMHNTDNAEGGDHWVGNWD